MFLFQGMNKSGLVKYFHLSVESLNSHLVEEFEAGNNPADVSIYYPRKKVSFVAHLK